MSNSTRVYCLILGLAWVCNSPVHAGPASQTIAVRIFVDEEEPRIVALWQETLAKRLDQASVILSQYGSLRFSVTKFSVWDSDDSLRSFSDSLAEFEKETKPEPAELAIGFTSQYQLKRGRSNLGGTRGPMRRHILIREGAPHVLESERLEVLVHELAHYMGAAHSGDQRSVMRPVLGDGRSRARDFRILLDTPNARIVNLISGEMATRHIRSMHQLTPFTKLQVRDQYLILARDFPKDEVAKVYAAVMERSLRRSLEQRKKRKAAAEKKAIQKAFDEATKTQGADRKTDGASSGTQ